MRKMPEPSAGEVWDLFLDPSIGHEQGGHRPALVVSSDHFNQVENGLHMVVPITGTNRNIRFHLPINPPDGGLAKESVLMCDQARSLSVLRFKRRRGAVSPGFLREVQAMVGMIIDC